MAEWIGHSTLERRVSGSKPPSDQGGGREAAGGGGAGGGCEATVEAEQNE